MDDQPQATQTLMARPSVFIGSASEGIDFAHGVRERLDVDAEITVWDELEGLGNTFIETLVIEASKYDFAILILTPDDSITSRETEAFAPRDNVIFELGLFMGTLGRKRTFLLQQAGQAMKVPSDLRGVTTATFVWPRADGSAPKAVGAGCDKIRREIQQQGSSAGASRLDVERVEARQTQLEAFEQRLMTQILPFLIPPPLLKHLEALEKSEQGRPKPADEYRGNESVRGQLRALRDLRLIDVAPGRAGIGDVPDATFDLARYVKLTDRGREWTRRAHENM